MTADGEFTIEALRGGIVESQHRIHAVVADRAGAVQVWGDGRRATIPRSAIKSIQALPLITTGAADAFAVSQDEVALACASHSGETEHVNAVLHWLSRLDLAESDLECGPDLPLGREARRAFHAARAQARPVFNCCSGKHAGFLTVARQLDQVPAGYINRESVVQQQVTGAIEIMTDLDLSQQASGIDGCGIPVFALPLERLAFAMARLVDPSDLDTELAEATERVVDAAKRAFWVSGTGRTEVQVCKMASEPVVIKTGAEGVFMAGLPHRGLGLAVKAADGASRAAQAAIRALLRQLDVLPSAEDGPAEPIHNKDGKLTGELRAVITAPDQGRLLHLTPSR